MQEQEFDMEYGLKRIMTKVLGQRDVSVHEALHIGYPLYNSNITVFKFSFENSKKLKIDDETNG